MNGGPPITESLSAQVAVLKLELASQPVPPMTTTYNPPVQTSIWDDLPLSITTTTGPISATSTATLYKSAIQNQPVHTGQPRPNVIKAAKATPTPQQRQHHQQQQQQDSDKMNVASTKSEISEISVSPTIQTIATILSTVTQAVEGMKNDLIAIEENRTKRKVKAIKSRIQRENIEKKQEKE